MKIDEQIKCTLPLAAGTRESPPRETITKTPLHRFMSRSNLTEQKCLQSRTKMRRARDHAIRYLPQTHCGLHASQTADECESSRAEYRIMKPVKKAGPLGCPAAGSAYLDELLE